MAFRRKLNVLSEDEIITELFDDNLPDLPSESEDSDVFVDHSDSNSSYSDVVRPTKMRKLIVLSTDFESESDDDSTNVPVNPRVTNFIRIAMLATLNSSVAINLEKNNVNVSILQQAAVEIYDVPVGIISLLSVCYGAVSLLAVVGNFCVLWIVATSLRMQTVTNFFIANLACADIIIGLFSIPFQFQAALLQRWVLPAFMCAFCPFVQTLSVNVSIFTLTAIALDRYRAVMFPLKARTTKLRAKFVILGIWAFAAAASVPYALALRVTYVYDSATGNYTKPFCNNVGIPKVIWKTYNPMLVCLQYFFPLFVISYAYGRMSLKLKDAQAPGNAEGARDAGILRNKRKVIKMLAIVVALFSFCWLPFQSYNLLQEIFPQINNYKYINVIWFCCHWLAMSNSCYNPFIYAIYNERFKREFRHKFHRNSHRRRRQQQFFELDNSNTMVLSVRQSIRVSRIEQSVCHFSTAL
ncbi:RYamide receptor-like [Limulus polyphemus]|uniref:RYamide receptor-like n=1 Tax=Limulus polyphemus TaxID=6850 RepID=A0ABM1SHW1_LIMPO|nr:RYamide receptor-like [Limulus polyphemus]